LFHFVITPTVVVCILAEHIIKQMLYCMKGSCVVVMTELVGVHPEAW